MKNQKALPAALRSKAEMSCSSYLTSHQIPVMSPSTKRLVNEDKTMSEFNVQNVESYYQSELVSKHNSPSKPSSPTKKSKSFSRLSQNQQNLHTVEESESCSPALSIDKRHMNEILNRCSPLKRTTYANPFLQGLQPRQTPAPQLDQTFEVVNERPAAEVNSSSTLEQENPIEPDGAQPLIATPDVIQEVKMFSPDPEPAQLQVTKAQMDTSPSPIRHCLESNEEAATLRKQPGPPNRGKTASDWLDVDYKLKILGVASLDKQEDQPGIFDLNPLALELAQSSRSKASLVVETLTLPCQTAAVRGQASNKLAQRDSKHSHSNSTFRIEPQKVYNASSASIASANHSKHQLEKLESPVSHYKRVKYSPHKRLQSPDKENSGLTLVKSSLGSAVDLSKDETRRRSKAERKQRSQNKQGRP